MSWQAAAWLMLGGSTVLIFIGLPVAFCFLVINLVGAWLFLGGEPGMVQLARSSVASVTSFSLTPIPLFVLMGEILFHTGLAVKVIDGIERLIHQVPGRLAVVAVVAGTVFSAISGSTIATTAMLGSLMLPVMLKRLTLTGSTLRSRDDAFKAALAASLKAKVWPLLSNGKVKPVIDRTLPLAQAAEAHRVMESSRHIGKIVLETSLNP